jgi:V/A-type H+-transporting ATPase subunit K
MLSFGLIMALLGIAISAILGPIGSSIGMSLAGNAAAGVLSEKPELYGRTLVIQAIPGTQGIYGFLVAVLLMSQIGLLGGSLATLNAYQGFAVFVTALPVSVVGLFSGIFQGKTAAAAIIMAGKNANLATRGMIIAAMIETAQLLALLVSVLMYISIPI